MTYVPQKWADSSPAFHLGINMAGAVSAGAYTAGALDFLMEALEQWYAAKATDPAVPQHEVSIDVFSGASAGGMCAAIASVMVQGQFDHIWNAEDEKVTGTSNTFYESWVNQIDIEPLLQHEDLEDGPLISLLDSSIIDSIADRAIVPKPTQKPAYIADSLTLFLTLTNVRGTPYALQAEAAGSPEQQVAYYADRIQFETVQNGAAPLSPFAKPLPLGVAGPEWELLKEAAKATGAFPAFLAPRPIKRPMEDYLYMPWLSADHTDPDALAPEWCLKAGETVTTLNVDGGVTDNDPFQLAHDYLAIHNPKARPNPRTGRLENPQAAEEANCAVLTIAPFPSKEVFDPAFRTEDNLGLLSVAQRLFTALLSQSRFLGESLVCLLSPSSFSRFILAPDDDSRKGQPALQCSLFSAFGGFFARSFRAHDYQLGRRNCQYFLSRHFLLAEENPIIAVGLKDMTPEQRAQAERRYMRTVKIQGVERRMYCILPLCGSASAESVVSNPPLGTITRSRLNHVLSMMVDRMHAVADALVEEHVSSAVEKAILRTGIYPLISLVAKPKLKKYLDDELGDVTEG